MFKIIRPDLADKTQRLYDRELKLLYEEYSVDDPLTLVELVNDLTIESKNLKHLFLAVEARQNKNLRVAVYRNLIDSSISKLNKKRGEEIVKLNEKINKLEIEITNLKYFIKQIHREYSDKIDKLLNDPKNT